ncbi:hypothetical protein [Rhizobium laguerreae]|nr:hypothetical protein [Rhizobium laguerreae]
MRYSIIGSGAGVALASQLARGGIAAGMANSRGRDHVVSIGREA